MVKDGIVGFFDILGYKAINRNNDIERVSLLISETLRNLPNKVKTDVSEKISGQQSVTKEKYIDPINVRLISDSILMSVHSDINVYDSSASADETDKYTWLMFLYYAAYFCREMFKIGLPIRGAIDFGRYFFDDHCFAGEPIINCYELSDQLELSGVVLTETAYNKYINVLGNKDHPFTKIIINHLVPFKNGAEQKLYMLNWFKFEETEHIDIRQEVYTSFSGYNKDVPQNVVKKVQNTEYSIRAMLISHLAKMKETQRVVSP